jgi:hypothetical protein
LSLQPLARFVTGGAGARPDHPISGHRSEGPLVGSVADLHNSSVGAASRLKYPHTDRDPKTHLPTKAAVADATARVKKAGFDLTRAVVITEAEHDRDYIMQSDDEIVFVLPDKKRVATPAANLLDTAKLLMACAPNGI